MNDKQGNAPPAKATRKRERQDAWRARVPEAQHLVEHVATRAFEAAAARRQSVVPEAWARLVTDMRERVHARVAADRDDEDHTATDEVARGEHWGREISTVIDMFEHLTRTIRTDIGFEGRATLASMVLVREALHCLAVELQGGGPEDGTSVQDENRYRVVQALMTLDERFDDVHMRRLRALQIAEAAVRLLQVPAVPSRSDVEADDAGEVDAVTQDFLNHDRPVVTGVLAQSWLAEIDEAFRALDPLTVLEEFGEAQVATRGGKVEGGDGQVGSVRALARLAVSCGALGFSQDDGQTYDDAVDRARKNLLTTRYRMRKPVRDFPGRLVGDEDEFGST